MSWKSHKQQKCNPDCWYCIDEKTKGKSAAVQIDAATYKELIKDYKEAQKEANAAR